MEPSTDRSLPDPRTREERQRSLTAGAARGARTTKGQKGTPDVRGGEATSDGPESRRKRKRWPEDETEPLGLAASTKP